MKSTGKGHLATAAKAVSDEMLLRVMRQSNKVRRRLRRAITHTGKPRLPEWTLQDHALLVLAKQFKRPESVVRSRGLQLGRHEPAESARG